MLQASHFTCLLQCLQDETPLQELQGHGHGAGHGAAHGAGHGHGHGGQHGFCVAQPVTNNAAAVTAKARPVFFIVIYPLDKIDVKFLLMLSTIGRQRVTIYTYMAEKCKTLSNKKHVFLHS